jgi:hypothetical protein
MANKMLIIAFLPFKKYGKHNADNCIPAFYRNMANIMLIISFLPFIKIWQT